jgi:exodeoxyribonuclease III
MRWLDKHKPDVLCLQELKVEDSAFPLADVQAAGYSAVLYGQKSYNGVAILSREPALNVQAGLNDGVDDPQARLLSAELHGLTFLSVYVPNGSEPTSDKFAYKLKWLERLVAYLEKHHGTREKLVLCGDLNIAPQDIDVARPDEWKDTVLCHAEVNGLRIDHVLVTQDVLPRCKQALIDREERKGKLPSDHAPVIVDIG